MMIVKKTNKEDNLVLTPEEKIEKEKRRLYLEKLFNHPNPFIVMGIEVKQREARDLEKEKKMSEEIKRRLDTFLKKNTLITILAFMNQQFHLLKIDEQVDLLNGVASKLGAKDKVVEVKNEKIVLTKEAYQKENQEETMKLLMIGLSASDQKLVKTSHELTKEYWQGLDLQGKVDFIRKLREEDNNKNLKGFSIALLSIPDADLKNAHLFDEAQKAYREKRNLLDPNTQKALDQKYQIQQQEVELNRKSNNTLNF